MGLSSHVPLLWSATTDEAVVNAVDDEGLSLLGRGGGGGGGDLRGRR